MASSSSFTNDEIKVRIQKVYAQFVTDVDPDRLSDWLVQENVFTVDQWQRIRHDNPPRDRCRALLNHLFSVQHPRAFLVVRQALKKENHYLLESIDNQEAESGIRVQSEKQIALQALLRDEIQLQELRDAYENHKRTWEAEKNRLLQIQKEHEVQKSSWKAEKARLLQIQKEQEYKERAWEAEKDCLLKKQNELETKLYQVMKEDASVGSVLPSLMSKITLAENTSGSSVDRQSPKDTANTQADLETEMNIVFEVGTCRRMSQLHLCENHSCSCIAFLDDFDYIELQIEEYRDSVTSKLLETGFLEIYQQVIRRCFKKAVTEGDDISENACLSVMIDSSSIVTRMTDNSFEACRKIIQLELDIDIISSLKSGHLDPRQKKQSFSSTRCDLVDALVKVLYNVVQVATEARELYREQGIIEVIQRFRTGISNDLSCSTLMLLAWVISDNENFILNSSEEDFSFLNQELQSSLHEVRHRSENEYKAVELLAAINKLVVNDANKVRFVKSGCLSSYVAFLEPQFDAEEQFLAAQGLCALAFKYAEEIKNEKTCVEKLELLLKKSEHDGVKTQVNGALIALGVKQERPNPPPKSSSKGTNRMKLLFRRSYQMLQETKERSIDWRS